MKLVRQFAHIRLYNATAHCLTERVDFVHWDRPHALDILLEIKLVLHSVF